MLFASLVAPALLQIAAELAPHDPQLKNRARLYAQLAVAGAASNADLNQQRQKLEGPVLGPADIASLVLALGFAALAGRPGEPRTLLQELQST